MIEMNKPAKYLGQGSFCSKVFCPHTDTHAREISLSGPLAWLVLITSGQSNLTERPHCRRTWTVQSYSLGDADVYSCLTHASFLGTIREHTLNGISIGSVAFAKGPYTLRWATPFLSKLPLCMGDMDIHLIHGSLGPPESTTQTASRSVQPFLQGSLV